MTATELDLLPTEQLLAALGRRFDAMIFGGLGQRTPDQTQHRVVTAGNAWAALGLTQLIAFHLSATIAGAAAPIAEEHFDGGGTE